MKPKILTYPSDGSTRSPARQNTRFADGLFGANRDLDRTPVSRRSQMIRMNRDREMRVRVCILERTVVGKIGRPSARLWEPTMYLLRSTHPTPKSFGVPR